MRITAFTDELSMKVKTVTLNGADVTKVTKWADAELGEVGLYPHRVDDSGRVFILELDGMCDDLKPLVNFSVDHPPRIPPAEAPIITVCGTVEITFKE